MQKVYITSKISKNALELGLIMSLFIYLVLRAYASVFIAPIYHTFTITTIPRFLKTRNPMFPNCGVAATVVL